MILALLLLTSAWAQTLPRLGGHPSNEVGLLVDEDGCLLLSDGPLARDCGLGWEIAPSPADRWSRLAADPQGGAWLAEGFDGARLYRIRHGELSGEPVAEVSGGSNVMGMVVDERGPVLLFERALVALDREGRPREGFGVEGRVSLDTRTMALALDEDGRLLLLQGLLPGRPMGLRVTRVLEDGRADPGFEAPRIPVDRDARWRIAPAGEGRSWVGLSQEAADGGLDLVLLRLDANGAPDPSFGHSGAAAYDLAEEGSFSRDRVVDLQPLPGGGLAALVEVHQNEAGRWLNGDPVDGALLLLSNAGGIEGLARFEGRPRALLAGPEGYRVVREEGTKRSLIEVRPRASALRSTPVQLEVWGAAEAQLAEGVALIDAGALEHAARVLKRAHAAGAETTEALHRLRAAALAQATAETQAEGLSALLLLALEGAPDQLAQVHALLAAGMRRALEAGALEDLALLARVERRLPGPPDATLAALRAEGVARNLEAARRGALAADPANPALWARLAALDATDPEISAMAALARLPPIGCHIGAEDEALGALHAALVGDPTLASRLAPLPAFQPWSQSLAVRSVGVDRSDRHALAALLGEVRWSGCVERGAAGCTLELRPTHGARGRARLVWTDGAAPPAEGRYRVRGGQIEVVLPRGPDPQVEGPWRVEGSVGKDDLRLGERRFFDLPPC